MSALGERTLIAHLLDSDSLSILIKEGLDLDVVPTEDLRPIVTFALRHYQTSGKAPTEAVLRVEYGDLLDDKEMSLDEPEEAIEWAIDDLKSTYVRQQSMLFTKRLAMEISEAPNDQKVEVLAGLASDLSRMVLSLQPRTTVLDFREADLVGEYEQRAAARGQVLGLRLGLPPIDEYTGGIHPGELGILAAPPKVGKSMFLDWVALKDWESGGVPALFTLENSISMTQGRIACFALHLDARAFSRGELPDDQVALVREWVNDVLRVADNPLMIFSPTQQNRTVEAMVSTAQAYGADSLILDQLNFIESVSKNKHQAKTYEVADVLRDLTNSISSGRRPLPCLLAHQINREGQRAAEAEGSLHMSHLADSASVERYAAWVFGLYQSADQRVLQRAQLQTLAARRDDIKNWVMTWQVGIGVIAAVHEVRI